jgi:5-formyltetrahydrofolate cyclo-ligase
VDRSNGVSIAKSELRSTYLSLQRSITPDERTRSGRLIANLFFASVLTRSARVVHCFIPIEKFNEIDTTPVFTRCWRDYPNLTTVVPRVDFGSGTMESVVYEPQHILGRNRWGMDEPAHERTVPASDIDIVLVPLVAYDLAGFRVGYGKGFYDRFLASCRTDCLKVGLSYFPPVEAIADTNEFDIALDLCITPTKIYSFSSELN